MEYLNCGMNEKTDYEFAKPIECSITDKDKLEKYGWLFLKLQLYTMYRDKFFVPFGIRREYSNIRYDEESKNNVYIDENINIVFKLLSDIISASNNKEEKRIKKELTSKKRFHKCHEASMNFALKDDSDSVFVLTGYVPSIDEELLHSVVEIDILNKKYIIDYTQNIVMKKEDYFEINQFRQISKVSSKTIKEDAKIIDELQIPHPYYLLFRDEIMKDLNKNKKSLKLED